MRARLRVLHLFREYLHMTENWAYRLIDNLPDIEVVVGSKYFLKNNFYTSTLNYIEFPVNRIENNTDRFLIRGINLFIDQLLKLYPWYIARMAGKIDLMHSHFSYVGWQYLRLAKRLNVPHVISLYGFDYEHLPHVEPAWRARYRKMFERADLFLCEGEHGARVLEKIGCPADKIEVARLGVDVDKIPFFERSKRAGELKLLQIATMIEKKGHVYTVKAFMDALETCPNMTMTLVGGNPEGIKKNLTDILAGTPAESRITFVDRINYDQLYDFMKDYHVFVHPSCHSISMDCEGGAPVVLLDAQATGMPVISTTHCDIPDEVVHGKTGLLTPEKDAAALTESIKTFYMMADEEYRKFAKAARGHVEKNYDIIHNAARMAEIYRRLAESFNR